MAKPIGTPCPSVSKLRLAPFFSPIGGVTACILTAQRRFRHRSIQTQPIPPNSFQLVELLNPFLPQFQEHFPFHPFLKSIVGGRTRTQIGLIQSFPLAAGSHHIKYPVRTLPIWDAWAPTPKTMRILMLWQ
jgi:hypothetical protein